MENCFEESGNVDCVYVVFHYRGRGRFCSTVGRSFESILHSNMRCRTVCSAFSRQVQSGVGIFSILWRSLWSSGQSFWLQIQRSRVRFPALPDFLSSSGSGTGSTQPREVN